ncbi:hypothetical protein [Paraglaciecola arctica]|uniref:hypothetical protein n=1 Tax=Paraglaciecola arctica TaxID=1128911 RepID=UPI001C07602B|nr:hypothetical protein [Paraglaciecola arctica]MBU3004218.1 hypothetical protein [Paraglaciecola arctica]
MTNSLENFIKEVTMRWSGLNTQTTTGVRKLLMDLAKAPSDEHWLKELHRDKSPASQLYHDSDHGFMLLAHTEKKGHYRSPHNHGAGWVFYTVQSGALEMNTYKQITTSKGITHLVSRGSEIMKAGDCKLFLPGDIHDTKCLSEDFMQFRLTSSDFKEEIKSGRMTRFINEPQV